MAKFIAAGETVEGAAADLCSRKWEKKGLKKHPITNKTMFLYVGDRNTSVEITKAIAEPDDEILRSATSHFHRKIGDILDADSISVFLDTKRSIRFVVKEGVSGRHGANIASIRMHTIATIKTPLNNLRKVLDYTPNKLLNEHAEDIPQ